SSAHSQAVIEPWPHSSWARETLRSARTITPMPGKPRPFVLYPANAKPKLDRELFKNPTAEYRGTPFWSWNSKLDIEQLFRQIEQFKEMGFGGFHIHSRTGLQTPYLSDEYMKFVVACTEKAAKESMLSWLYDEDRWPSGFAGG